MNKKNVFRRGLNIFGMMLLCFLFPSCFAYINNNEGRPTCVSDPGNNIIQECGGAHWGMEKSSYINENTIFYNPTENLFNNYLKTNEFVFFAGHGNPNAIGGNTNNGFSNNIMTYNELDNNLKAKVVTLMTCESLQKFGQKLVDKGVECVVGWEGTLSTSSATEAQKRPYYFYTCSGWHDPDYCEDYASIRSGLGGSSVKGNCNTFGMSSKSINKKEENFKGYKQIKNGEIFISYPEKKIDKFSKSKKFSEKELITLAINKLDISNNYKLSNVENKKYGYGITFTRYINDIKVPLDKYIIYINKYTANIYMYRKTFTPNMKKKYLFSHTKNEIIDFVNSIKDIKDIKDIEKILLTENETKKARSFSYIDQEGFTKVIYIQDKDLTIMYN